MSQNTRATTRQASGPLADHCLDRLCREIQINLEALTRMSRAAASILHRAGVNLDPNLTISEQAQAARLRGETWGIALCHLLDQFDPGHCGKQPMIHGIGGFYEREPVSEEVAVFALWDFDLVKMFQELRTWSTSAGLPDPMERIISGYRSQAKQDMLRQAWDRGEREGIVVRPAERSKHTEGKAFDLRGDIHELTAWGQQWEKQGGIWGGRWFPRADRQHFQIS